MLLNAKQFANISGVSLCSKIYVQILVSA